MGRPPAQLKPSKIAISTPSPAAVLRIYLTALAANLENELCRLGRLEWFVQSCDKAREATRINRERDLDSLWRISGSGKSAWMITEFLDFSPPR